jgi:hypothetical protein
MFCQKLIPYLNLIRSRWKCLNSHFEFHRILELMLEVSTMGEYTITFATK